MMTSVGGNRNRANWEQTQTQSQSQHKQRPQVSTNRLSYDTQTHTHGLVAVSWFFSCMVKTLYMNAEGSQNTHNAPAASGLTWAVCTED